MMSEHILQQVILSPELNSVDFIYKKMEAVFEEQNRLLVLLDQTLAPNIFDDLKANFREENIIYIPLAKGNGYKDTNLFFIEIVDKKLFEKVGVELAEHLLNNFDIDNDQYLVHGFGSSNYENDELNKKFKKSLVFEDIESKILFRWYDPRVMTYLDDIFNEHQMNSLLGSFIQWQFIHPSGYFQWKHIGQNKLQSKAITQINGQQSLALDLIEIANIVFKKSHEIEQVDVSKLKPKQILKNIYQGHEQFKITKYTDLLSYGLYAEVLGKNFMMHPYIIEILKLNWGVQPDDHDFMNAMNYISTDDWVLIRQDLENYNLGI